MKTPFCNICGRLPFETETKRLCVDHNHVTNCIRGWLCDLCNNYVYIYESNNENAKKNYNYLFWFARYNRRIISHVESQFVTAYYHRKQWVKMFYKKSWYCVGNYPLRITKCPT
jgi:hypothetical protein